MPKKPYLIDGVIGNSKMLASLDSRGQLHRLWWPRIDFPQHVDELLAGIFIPGKTKRTVWLHEKEFTHQQSYVGDTPILKTVATSETLGLEISSEDEIIPGQDVMVRHYTFTNNSGEARSFTFLSYSSFHMRESGLYNTTMFDLKQDALIHYRHEHAIAISASMPVTGYQAGHVKASIKQARLNGNVIDMHSQGGLSWDLGEFAPGESKSLTLFFAAGDGPDEALKQVKQAQIAGQATLRQISINYWADYLSQARPVQTGNQLIDRLYRRSLIVFKLMTDDANGSMIAAPEFDEEFSRCGGYAYCWGRDAAYITTAVDRAGYHQMGREFYRWTVRAQSADGSWQQRHYLDGRLAPQWGLQIDETGSILWGMWQHYLITRDPSFLDEIWESVKKGAEFLIRFIDPETGLPLPSRDLWEERDAEHTYSAAAVFGGLTGASEIARVLRHDQLAQTWTDEANKIRKAISKHCWNEERQVFYRGLKLAVTPEKMAIARAQGKKVVVEENSKGYPSYMVWEDPVVDVSLLGVNVPFELYPIDDERVVKTADAVEQFLTSHPVGGIKRYEDDNYIGGNPWILTTLWLAMFRIKQGKTEDALKLFNWAVEHRTHLDLLPEQIDRQTGETAWVVPLTWSHAMFVLTVLDLVEAGVFAQELQA